MKIDIISSLVLGTLFFLLVFCVLDVRAEVNTQAYSHKFGQPYLSPVDSVKSTASKPKLFRRAKKWTPEDDERLIRLRAQRKSWEELTESFEGRTWQALQTRHSRLTKDRSKPSKNINRWAEEEKELLLELVRTGVSDEEIATHFPGRSPVAIQDQYIYLTRGKSVPRRVNRKFTAEEDERILKLRGEGRRWKEMVPLFDDRSLSSLTTRFTRLISSDFTPEEDELLRELEEENIPWPERVTFFDNRTLDTLQERLKVLKSIPTRLGSKFTPEEDDLIVEAVESGENVEEIAQSLERSKRGVYHRIERLRELKRLAQIPKVRRYIVDDLELIRERFETGVSYEDIATERFPERGSRSVQRVYERCQARRQKEDEQEE